MKPPEKINNEAPHLVDGKVVFKVNEYAVGYNAAIDKYEEYCKIAIRAAVMTNEVIWRKWIESEKTGE